MAFEMFSQMFGGKKFFGSKPDIPQPPTAWEIGADFAKANLQNLPEFQKLAGAANAFDTEQINKMLATVYPELGKTSEQIGKNTLAMTRGEIPEDVAAAVTRSSAARALGGGYAGSKAHGNLVARDLGLTSLQLTQQGLDSASRWLAASRQFRTPQGMNVGSMFVQSQLPMKWQRDVLQAKIEAAPDPVARGRADQEMALFSAILSAAGGIAGAAGCWVAREVFGHDNPEWCRFRDWVMNRAPAWFRKLYVRYGRGVAEWIHDKPRLKGLVRAWMRTKIARSV